MILGWALGSFGDEPPQKPALQKATPPKATRRINNKGSRGDAPDCFPEECEKPDMRPTSQETFFEAEDTNPRWRKLPLK
jgi:hypothetical protein